MVLLVSPLMCLQLFYESYFGISSDLLLISSPKQLLSFPLMCFRALLQTVFQTFLFGFKFFFGSSFGLFYDVIYGSSLNNLLESHTRWPHDTFGAMGHSITCQKLPLILKFIFHRFLLILRRNLNITSTRNYYRNAFIQCEEYNQIIVIK